MIYRISFFLMTVLFLNNSAIGAEWYLKHERGDIILPKVENWEVKEKIFGMPYMIFSERLHGQRSNISFTHSGLDFPFKVSEIEQSLQQYINIKKQWTQKVGGQYLVAHESQKLETLLGHELYTFGFEYQFKEKHYIEKSYFLKCRGRMIYAKSLRLKESLAHEAHFNYLLNHFNCS